MSDRMENKDDLLQLIPLPGEAQTLQEGMRTSILEVLFRRRKQGIEKSNASLEAMKQRYGAVHFLEKFNRQKEGKENYFDNGEKVAAPFIIVDVYREDATIDDRRIGLMVEKIDTRVADTFVVDVSPEEYALCQQYKGMEFEGVVEVTGPAKYKVSNMFEYPAKALNLVFNLPVNPESIESLEFGDSVIIEGEMVDFRIIEHWSFKADNEKEPRAKMAIITVRTEDGRHLFVQIDPRVKLEQSSNLENIRGKVPEIGDVVRIKTNVRKHGVEKPEYNRIMENPHVQNYYGEIERKESSLWPAHRKIDQEIKVTQHALSLTLPENRDQVASSLQELQRKKEKMGVKVLGAPWCRSTYLLKPSAAREQRYRELRQKVTEGIEAVTHALSLNNYSAVRECLARLIKLEVTVKERAQLNRIAVSMPLEERPLMLWSRYEADEINTLFDADIDKMTVDDYYEFARNGVATLYSLQGKKRGDHSYLYRIFKDVGMSKERQSELLSLAIETRWRYFQELEAKGQAYLRDRDWSDKYMLEQSLGYLSGVKTPSSTQKLIDFAYEIIMAENLFGEAKGEFTYKAADSLERGFYGIEKSPELFEVYQKNAQKIRKMEAHLASIQSHQPDSTTSPIVFILENIGQPAMISRPTIHHRFSSELRSLRKIVDGINPELRQLKEGDFNKEIHQTLAKLAENNVYFRAALDAVLKKGYSFIRFEEGDANVPLFVQEMMTGANGAITVKQTRSTYFDLNALQTHAFQKSSSTESQVLKALIDECFHIMSDRDYASLSYEATLGEVEKMSSTRGYLDSEKMMQSIVEEEIVAHVLSELVFSQVASPDFKISVRDFDFPQGARVRELAPVKIQFGINVLKRIYSLNDEHLVQEEFKPLVERLVYYLNSGKTENAIQQEIKRYGLAFIPRFI